ncbi:class I SAM-dependent methyltransferase [Terrimonas sp. NA20]|uniref:Class I SAM-dependent methyltransferase n=1 Tax=Terrimonas ginsenosidimutans TaxID=2908004 RepID=A0ABS9KWB6_9BACT|nr:class I SAM-dependent methyltransferase [Terrimonas ginsenosidimutans]MCG2616610.1 class I SAM-dependent methyltransferase [Terrimonas ginsenosidimutans]
MQPSEAISMLEPAGWISNTPQTWADLGCGKGIFSLALASLLPPKSNIYSIDRDADSLQFLPQEYHGVKIETIQQDFTTLPPLPPLDGIIMANALHYIRNRDSFAQVLTPALKENARLIIVEYDTDTANRWVPFPVNFNALEKWAGLAGFRNVRRLKERASIYQRSKMYSAVMDVGFVK